MAQCKSANHSFAYNIIAVNTSILVPYIWPCTISISLYVSVRFFPHCFPISVQGSKMPCFYFLLLVQPGSSISLKM